MSEKLICPMTGPQDLDCLEGKCAWWNGPSQCCAVTAIPTKLSRPTNRLNNIDESLQNLA